MDLFRGFSPSRLTANFTLAVMGVTIAIALPRSAMAQTNEAATSGTLEEVVVTAERRTTDLQKTAVAVSVRDGAELQNQGRYDLAQILEDVPSVSMQTPNRGTGSFDSPANDIAIRGIKANGSVNGSLGASVVPASAYYVDGVLGGIGGNYDITQIGILRGPQGTLYGRSATAGAVIVQTKDPVINLWSADAAAELGSYGLQHYRGGVNLPVNDVLAVRVSADKYRRNGYYATEGGKVEGIDGRVKLLYQPTKDLSVLFGLAMENNPEHFGELGAFTTGQLGTDAVAYNTAVPLGSGYDKTRQYWANVTWNLGFATLTYIPALREFDQHLNFDLVPVPIVVVNNQADISRDRFHTEELHLASNAEGPLRWQTGLFYYDNSLLVRNQGVLYAPFLPPEGLVIYGAQPEARRTQNIGAFAETTYSVTQHTRLTTGLRGDYTKVQTSIHSCSGLPVTCLDLSGQAGERTWNNLTYKLRLEHDITSTSLVYASLSSAFLPGDVAVTTGQNGNPAPAPYEPEMLHVLEFGSKNRFLANTLQVNAAAFYYRYGGYQLPVATNPGGAPLFFQVMNSPARMVGAELEVELQATPRDRLGLNVSYVDAYYNDKPPLFALAVDNSHFPGVVPWNVDATYRHVFPLPRGQSLTFTGDALYRSSYLVIDYDPASAAAGLVPYLRNGSTLIGNLSLAWQCGPHASVSAYVRNVSDVRYKTFIGLTSPVPAGDIAALSDPRTFGAVLSVKF